MDSPLLILPTVPCHREGDRVLLDRKFESGMRLYCDLWGGRVRCLMREDPDYASPFAGWVDAADLPFALETLPADAAVSADHLRGSIMVLAGGDDHRQADVSELCEALGIPCVYGVEYGLETRLRILLAERRNWFSTAKSILWTLRSEVERRRAFAVARSLQSNGSVAHAAYGPLSRDCLLYFDSRMGQDMLASPADLAAATRRRQSGAPLRLLYTGRLERMKGAHHLIPVMVHLRNLGSTATLDIFGAGTQQSMIEAAIVQAGLEEQVTLHAPLDFETELVPHIKGAYDIFLCCHPQSDPSCTYVETLGCGIPIMGYANRAWAGILALGDVGWSVPLGREHALAHAILRLDRLRGEIDHKAAAALDFAEGHTFEAVFARRIDHLRQMAAA